MRSKPHIVLWLVLLVGGCSQPAADHDAAMTVDGAGLDAATDGEVPPDAEPDWDAAVDAASTEPCLGTCDASAYNACTCGAADPCGWQANGICDDACRAWLPSSHFDDLPDCDADQDGLYDSVELELALAFEPFMWLSASEEGYRADRLPHFAVEPSPDGGGGLSIFYAQSYFEDYGDPDFGGLTSHLGDSEFVVVELTGGGGPWQLDRVFLSAHYRAVTDSSGWYDVGQLQLHADATGLEHPIVYVSEWKHANYRDLQSCDNGGLFTDHCEEHALVRLGIEPGRNVGNPGAVLVDDVLHDGNHEFYFTDVRFCGWRVASLDNGDRGGCTGTDSTYGDFMGWWLADQL